MDYIQYQFGDFPLDEEAVPARRLDQACNEAGIPKGPFRSLITTELVGSVERIGIENIEDALKATSKAESDADRFRLFFRSLPSGGDVTSDRHGEPAPIVRRAAETLFPDAPLRLWHSLPQWSTLLLHRALPTLYGSDVLTRPEFFRGEKLFDGHSIPDGIHRVLFGWCLVREARARSPKPAPLADEWLLEEVPATEDFVVAIHLAQCRSSAADAADFRWWSSNLSVGEIVQLMEESGHFPGRDPSLRDGIDSVREMLTEIAPRLREQEILHARLDGKLPRDWYSAPLLADLDDERVGQLIEVSLTEDIATWSRGSASELLEPATWAAHWYVSPFWKQYWAALTRYVTDSNRPTHLRLAVLRHSIGPGVVIAIDNAQGWPSSRSHLKGNLLDQSFDFWECAVDHSYRQDWDRHLAELPTEEGWQDEFLSALIRAARGRLSNDALEVRASKCIGLLRRRLAEDCGNWTLREYRDAIELLGETSPDKLLRLMLMAMRACPRPCADESLARPNARQHADWTDETIQPSGAIICLLLDMFRGRFPIARENEHEFDLPRTVCQYCIERLQLRRGQKVSGTDYRVEQCTEPSPIWRIAYLKCLTELHQDPGGLAHRTANFVRRGDPDADVRSVATTTYRVVRRTKSGDETELRRGAMAALWWLRLAQRQALGEVVDADAARRTRRRELRAIH